MTDGSLFDRVASLAGGWGQWMVSMSWQVAVVVAALTIITLLCRRRSAVLLHSIWLLVLVRLLLPPDVTFPTGWGWWIRPGIPAGEDAAAQQSITEAGTKSDKPSRGPSAKVASAERDAPAESDSQASPPVESSAPNHERPDAERIAERGPAPDAAERRRAWTACIMLAWAGVSGTLLGLLALGSLRIRRWVRDAEPIDDPALYAILEECRTRLRLRPLVELRNSDACTTPVVVGFLRPVILLPRAVLTELSPDELRAVLLHELFHIARGDALVNFIQGVLGAIYFFHPLVWWANAKLRELREEACDELTVAALGGERRAYGAAIVRVTEIFGYASPPLALGVLETKNPARRRLARILDPHLPRGDRMGWKSVLAVILLGAVLLPGAAPKDRRPADAPPAIADAGLPASDGEQAPRDDRAIGREVRPAEFRGPPQPDPAAQPLAATVPPPLLRYKWQPGRSYSYAVQIEAESADEVETLSGTPVWQARTAGADGAELTFFGRLTSSRRVKNVNPFNLRPPRFSNPFTSNFGGVGVSTFPEEHFLKLDDRGRITTSRGDSQLPYTLGNLSELLLEQFPAEPRTKWSQSRQTSITLFRNDDRFPIPRPRIGPLARRDEGQRLDATERRDFTIESDADGQIVIRREYTLTTTELVAGEPRLELAGTAKLTFALDEGVLQALEGEYRLVQNEDNVTRRTPIKITARLLTEGELEQQQEEQAAAAALKPLDDEALEQALEDLRSGERVKIHRGAAALEHAEPTQRRREVAEALEALLGDENNFTRQSAAKALAVWCTPESVPVLVKALDDRFFTVPWAALDALGKLKAPEAVDHIVDLIRTNTHRQQALAALEQIGPAAEAGVLRLLEHYDWSIRNDACRLLRTLGTDASRRRLERAATTDGNSSVRRTASEALEEIRKRADAR